jgi:nitrate reductase NapE component
MCNQLSLTATMFCLVDLLFSIIAVAVVRDYPLIIYIYIVMYNIP